VIRDQKTDGVAYVLCALTLLAGLLHLNFLHHWPGWDYRPHSDLIAYAIRMLPFAALAFCAASAVLNAKGFGRTALRIAYWSFIPSLCVLVLDGLSGTIGFVD
jgi:hypothetical protein